MRAVQNLDRVCASSSPERGAQQWRRGVRVGFLKSWFLLNRSKLPPKATTTQVVLLLVKPMTCRTRGRLVELFPAEHVGGATVFASHTWGAPFADLMAGVSHVLHDDDFVWIDILAVRQWPGFVASVLVLSLQTIFPLPLCLAVTLGHTVLWHSETMP